MEKVLNKFGKELLDRANNERLISRVERIIKLLFQDKELEKANLYKNIIISYIKENIKPESLINDSTLASIIKVYYDILNNRSVSIEKYLYLQSQSRTQENAIAREIEKEYLDSKSILLSSSELFDINVSDYNNTERLVDEILMKYEDRNERGRLYGEVFQKYKNDQEKSIMLTKTLMSIDRAYNILTIIKASNLYHPYQEEQKVR